MDCYDTTNRKMRKKGMFVGAFIVSANIGIGCGDDSGLGANIELTPSNSCDLCRTDIGDITYSLSAIAFAGFSIGNVNNWSFAWTKPIGSCSASKGCNWSFTTEQSTYSVGIGATGARISVVGDGKTNGTVSKYDR